MLYSLLINLKNSFINFEIATYSEWGVFLSFALLAHNIMAAYYAYYVFHFYLSLSLKNMHSVEDTMILALY